MTKKLREQIVNGHRDIEQMQRWLVETRRKLVELGEQLDVALLTYDGDDAGLIAHCAQIYAELRDQEAFLDAQEARCATRAAQLDLYSALMPPGDA